MAIPVKVHSRRSMVHLRAWGNNIPWTLCLSATRNVAFKTCNLPQAAELAPTCAAAALVSALLVRWELASGISSCFRMRSRG